MREELEIRRQLLVQYKGPLPLLKKNNVILLFYNNHLSQP